MGVDIYPFLLSPPRPSLTQSSDTESPSMGPRPPGLVPKFAISAEDGDEESLALRVPTKLAFSIEEDEADATTPGSTHSGATLSGMEASSTG